MVAYSVFQNPNPRTNAAIPVLLDVQFEVLSVLGTRAMVPLDRPEAADGQALSRLTPVVQVQGKPLVAMVPELAGIARRELGPVSGDLASARAEIRLAIDLLLTGF
jgi:toxin CcdB